MWLNIAFVITLPYAVHTIKSYGVRVDGEDSNHRGKCNMWLKSACLEKVFFFFSHSHKPIPDNADRGFLKFYNS